MFRSAIPAKYENNEVLSVYRALAVTDQLRKTKT